ncbi:hypothetical protein POJ06DRAFT_103854 [Lipomyces tetrasporus]|uniref:Uncharacterized protein n=1 Tax=Lipomyces tetrasporus TaxID=54092 RepID=A0AAD7VRU2_9ASCO|nr:uncharacterized protein POJ06DRAFT_103854 [Lipomyces tetrasporus]KAJ8100402.1 hypothetical protein POJ06DRAFT_103854 [Lipomyces tetrasporus]
MTDASEAEVQKLKLLEKPIIWPSGLDKQPPTWFYADGAEHILKGFYDKRDEFLEKVITRKQRYVEYYKQIYNKEFPSKQALDDSIAKARGDAALARETHITGFLFDDKKDSCSERVVTGIEALAFKRNPPTADVEKLADVFVECANISKPAALSLARTAKSPSGIYSNVLAAQVQYDKVNNIDRDEPTFFQTLLYAYKNPEGLSDE